MNTNLKKGGYTVSKFSTETISQSIQIVIIPSFDNLLKTDLFILFVLKIVSTKPNSPKNSTLKEIFFKEKENSTN